MTMCITDVYGHVEVFLYLFVYACGLGCMDVYISVNVCVRDPPVILPVSSVPVISSSETR